MHDGTRTNSSSKNIPTLIWISAERNCGRDVSFRSFINAFTKLPTIIQTIRATREPPMSKWLMVSFWWEKVDLKHKYDSLDAFFHGEGYTRCPITWTESSIAWWRPLTFRLAIIVFYFFIFVPFSLAPTISWEWEEMGVSWGGNQEEGPQFTEKTTQLWTEMIGSEGCHVFHVSSCSRFSAGNIRFLGQSRL